MLYADVVGVNSQHGVIKLDTGISNFVAICQQKKWKHLLIYSVFLIIDSVLYSNIETNVFIGQVIDIKRSR